MAHLRIKVDLAIPKNIADKPAVKSKLLELYTLLKLAKSYAVKINEGSGVGEMTVSANYHICHHDTNGACESKVEV